jgi:RPA family protein
MVELKQRTPAKRTWIANIIHGAYHRSEGWNPSYVEYGGEKYSRISVLSTVVNKFISEDGNYGTITLDDGTETIRVKVFGPDVAKIKSVELGQTVRCVGKLKQYSDEVYIYPEFIYVVDDPNWILLHRLQLGEPVLAPSPEEAKPVVPEQVAMEQTKIEAQTVQAKVLTAIRKLDSGLGASFDSILKLIDLSEEETKAILTGLLKSGDVYEPKKGFYKVLE